MLYEYNIDFDTLSAKTDGLSYCLHARSRVLHQKVAEASCKQRESWCMLSSPWSQHFNLSIYTICVSIFAHGVLHKIRGAMNLHNHVLVPYNVVLVVGQAWIEPEVHAHFLIACSIHIQVGLQDVGLAGPIPKELKVEFLVIVGTCGGSLQSITTASVSCWQAGRRQQLRLCKLLLKCMFRHRRGWTYHAAFKLGPLSWTYFLINWPTQMYVYIYIYEMTEIRSQSTL